jgi:hypothetical protein
MPNLAKRGLFTFIILLGIIILFLFTIGIPLPFKKIAYQNTSHNLCQTGACCWDIYYNDSDPEYLSTLNLWHVPKPSVSFKKSLISTIKVKKLSVRISFNFESSKFLLETFVKLKPTDKNGLYFYSIPNLPYDRLHDFP